MGRLIDLTGKKFGRLTAIKRSYPNDKWNSMMWLCKCDCGKETITRGKNLRDGATRSCGCLQKDNHYKLEPGFANMHGVMRRYKRQAGQRGYSFDLTDEQFFKITKQNCYYCGAKPNNTIHKKTHNGAYTYNGIDRIDNTKGYIMDNVVPCCHPCNQAKSKRTLQEFKVWVKNVYNNMYGNVN